MSDATTGELYTASRIRVWRECQRKEFYKYTLGLQVAQSFAMAFGTVTHAALEAWYLAWQRGADRFAAALEAINASELDDTDRIRLRVLLAAYDARWGAEDWDIVAVEVEFTYYLGDIRIGGKIDALIRHRETGLVYVVEHKTSSADTSPGSPYWQKLTLDAQVSIYIDGAAYGLDHNVAGCIYDVIKRPQHEPLLATPEESRKFTVGKGCKKCGGSAKAGEIERGRGYYVVAFAGEDKRIDCECCAGTGWKIDPKTGNPEAPRLHANQRDRDETFEEFEDRLTNEVADRLDEYLVRVAIVRLDDELPTRRQELIDTITAMRALAAADLHPPNHSACSSGRDMCPFFAACAGMADLSSFPRGAAHSELTQAA